MTTKIAWSAGREQAVPFSEYELETVLVKERIAGPESLTPEEQAILASFNGSADYS